jgi:drug/metabolite transporter (DMT)-like permease
VLTSKLRHALRVIAGVFLIVAGVVGLLLPIIPGIPLLAAGVFTLGVDHPWVRPITARLRRHGILRRRDSERSR